MSDVLEVGQWGAVGPIEFGLSSASDNHGNVFRGMTLNCAGKPMSLSFLDTEVLMQQVRVAELPTHTFFTDTFPLEVGQLSPLQTMCTNLKHGRHPTFGDFLKNFIR